MKIKKNDIVKIISGEDRGKTGKVLVVMPGKNRVIVERVAVAKKHVRSNPAQQEQGGIIEKERPVDVSTVMLFCPRCNRGIRVGCKMTSEGAKARYCRRCEEMI